MVDVRIEHVEVHLTVRANDVPALMGAVYDSLKRSKAMAADSPKRGTDEEVRVQGE